MNEEQQLVKAVKVFEDELSWRPKTKNELYFMAKLQEEVGELAEASLACEGSTRKIRKLKEAGVTPQERFLEELSDVLNVVLLFARQKDIPLSVLFNAASKKMIEKGREIHGK